MRILLLLCLFITTHAYAEDNDGISIIDAPLASTDPVQKTDDERLSACENNLQNLTGRVETLEHAVKELQANPAAAPSVIPVATGTDASAAATTPHPSATASSDEKREYDVALAALKESRFADAENLFFAFLQKHPTSDLAGNAYFWYADSFYRRGDFDKAAIHYLKGYKLYPKSPKAADNLLKLALSLGELKKNKDACAMLDKLDAEFKHRPASSMKRAHDARGKYCK